MHSHRYGRSFEEMQQQQQGGGRGGRGPVTRLPAHISPIWVECREALGEDQRAALRRDPQAKPKTMGSWDLIESDSAARGKSPERTSFTGLLTAAGRSQLVAGERMCNPMHVRFIGDVWSSPVCSYESRLAVNALQWLANTLNRRLGRRTSTEHFQQQLNADLALADAGNGQLAKEDARALKIELEKEFRIDAHMRQMASYPVFFSVLAVLLACCFLALYTF
jgi:hypothetical protein